MKVLIIEDDLNKLQKLREYIAAELIGADVHEARAYQSGLKALRDWGPDLVLLDMSMPTYEVGGAEQGGRPRAFAGKQLLHEMKRRGISARAVVVTQFDTFGEGPEQKTLAQLTQELNREYAKWYAGAVYYDPATSDWREKLRKILAKSGR